MPNWSVAETFERVRHHLPRSLDPAALERCARIVAHVPNEARSHYLEYRLGSGPQVDFLTLSTDRGIAGSLATRLGDHPSVTWQQHLAILREWAASNTALASVPFVCFEYDADRASEAYPEASLVIGLERDYRRRHLEALSPVDEQAVELGKVAFHRLLPIHARDACLAVLERIYAALPPLGAIPHAPVMAAREPITAKPYVILPRDSVHDFLRRVEWPGSFAALDELLQKYYSPFQKSIYLDLTVTDRVGDRLGIATSQFQRQEADYSSLDWWRLPPELEHYKHELKDWVGHSEETLGGERVWIRRWLDTKVVLKGTQLEYKAYLGFSPSRPPLFC